MNADALQFHGHSADHWLRVRTTGDDEARWEAIDAIRHICVPTVSMPLFLDTLANDSYWRSRALAAHAIYDLAWESEFQPLVAGSMPALIKALEDASSEVLEQIIVTLELLRSAAAPALESLRRIAAGEDTKLASLANAAVQAIDS